MAKFSKQEFEGYTHRHLVEFNFNDSLNINSNIYSDSGNQRDVTDYIKERQENISHLKTFRILDTFSKEEDESISEFIDGLK